MDNFKEILKLKTDKANAAVERFLPDIKDYPGKMQEAIRYSVMAGGKRLRPVMMAETYALFGGEGNEIEPFEAAIEYIHTASLIHDDLPALDNDCLRRGQPTTHAKYGEALGVLTADALLNHAYETMLKGIAESGYSKTSVRAAALLAHKGGINGMLGGQDIDVETEKKIIESDEMRTLMYIYERKTAALFEGSLMCGAILAGADEESIRSLEKIGSSMGIAFQIRDDILDVTGDEKLIGKPVLSDEKNEKDTFVSLQGLSKAQDKVRALSDIAAAEIRSLPGNTDFLYELILGLAGREK